jgi:hypothetical protein
MISWLRYGIFFILLCGNVVAQERHCATMDLHKIRMDADAVYRQKFTANQQAQVTCQAKSTMLQDVITIPVVVHVLYNSIDQNIADEVIKSQIDVLNEDYSALSPQANDIPAVWLPLAIDAKIRFCLAHTDPNGNPTSGIKRYQTTVSSFSINDTRLYSTQNGGADAWSNSSYLNIWVAPLSNNILGFSSLPGAIASQDGIVISYAAFGRSGSSPKSPYNLGRTATHEIGHWLNLLHIWGDDAGGCSMDDGVGDTPLQANSNTRCSGFPKTDACSPNYPGIMFMNFMDYTDDKCMSFFTEGQSLRMQNAIANFRSSIINSPGKNYTIVNGPEVGIDSTISPVKKSEERCYQPSFRIRNYGNTSVANIPFTYRLNDGIFKQYIWKDTLSVGESAIVELPSISSPEEDRFLEISMALTDSIKSDNFLTIGVRMSSTAIQNCQVSPLSLYPNPVGASAVACLKTNFESSRKSRIRVYDATGRIVFEESLELNSGDAVPLNLVSLRSGLYIAEVKSDVSVETIKFIYNSTDHSIIANTICN